jgi:hypothetical protein
MPPPLDNRSPLQLLLEREKENDGERWSSRERWFVFLILFLFSKRSHALKVVPLGGRFWRYNALSSSSRCSSSSSSVPRFPWFRLGAPFCPFVFSTSQCFPSLSVNMKNRKQEKKSLTLLRLSSINIAVSPSLFACLARTLPSPSRSGELSPSTKCMPSECA